MENKRKVALITGGSKGIGYALAEKFAQEKFDLILTSRSGEDLRKVKQTLEYAYGITCHVFAADLSHKNEVKIFCDFACELTDKLDVLVNNTGTFLQGKLMEEEEGQLESQINTNVYSAYYMTRGVVELLKNTEKSHVFNICSIASLQAYDYSGSYTISKFALLGFSKSLRNELMPQVRVTSVMPGATLTSSWAGTDFPDERFIKSADIADIVWAAYNLSPSAVVEDIVIRPTEGDI